MEIELQYQPRTTYRGYPIEIATGIGGYHARAAVTIDDETTTLLETVRHTEQGALQAIRRSIVDVLFAEGSVDEPSPHFPTLQP